MCNKIKERKLNFVLNPDDSWSKFDDSLKNIVKGAWQEVKFLDDTCLNLHSSMTMLPKDSGGIYIFVLKPEIIPNTHLYILYIGRARHTDKQNLRKRCSEYLKDGRPKIFTMIKTWGKDLYIRYMPLSDNNMIDKLESALIDAIFPPCNDRYPNKITREAVKAAFM